MEAESGFQSIGELLPCNDPELRRMARQILRRKRAEHTPLVNEALVRLCKGNLVPWDESAQIVALVLPEMRRELTDHVRALHAQMRSWHLRGEGPADVVAGHIDADTVVAIDLRYYGTGRLLATGCCFPSRSTDEA